MRDQSTKEIIAASDVCMGFWCSLCDSIIPRMNFHREHPERCGNG